MNKIITMERRFESGGRDDLCIKPRRQSFCQHMVHIETSMLTCMICCSLSNAPTSSMSRSS